MNVYEVLIAKFEEKVTPLRTRYQEVEEEYRRLCDGKHDTMLRAQVELLERAVTEATAKGDFPAVEALRKEIVVIENELQQRDNEREALLNEREKLTEVMKRTGDEALNEVFPSIELTAWKKWEDCVDWCESTWLQLQRFSRESGAVLSLSKHQLRLVPDHSYAPKLDEKINRWIVGKAR